MSYLEIARKVGAQIDREKAVTETAIVRRARFIIYDALNAPMDTWDDGSVRRVELAKWVIENIWTPDVDKDAA